MKFTRIAKICVAILRGLCFVNKTKPWSNAIRKSNKKNCFCIRKFTITHVWLRAFNLFAHLRIHRNKSIISFRGSKFSRMSVIRSVERERKNGSRFFPTQNFTQQFYVIIDEFVKENERWFARKANTSSRIQQSRNDIPGIMELEQGWRAAGDFNY